MSRMNVVIVLGFTVGAFGQGPEYRLQPVGVTDVEEFTLTDNEGSPGVPSELLLVGEIGPNATVEFHIRMSDWGDAVGSPELGTYQAGIDGENGYSSGDGSDLVPLGGCCPGDPAGGFIDEDNPEWVHGGLAPPCFPLPATNLTSLNYELGSSIFGGCTVPDDGTIKYGATLVLSIPPDAHGTYTIDLVESETKTFMNDPLGDKILPLTRTPVLVTVYVGRCCYDYGYWPRCADGITEAECSALAGGSGYYYFRGQACETPGQTDCDGVCNFHPNYCWDELWLFDSCRWGECNFDTGECEWWPIFDTAEFCCNSETGALTPIQEGTECLFDYCLGYCRYHGEPCTTDADCPGGHYDWCLGAGQQAPMPAGSPCQHEDQCAANVQCDGSGTCIGDLPENLQIPCSQHDECPSPWYCDPDSGFCDCLDNWDNVRKNRYISFHTEDIPSDLAYQVEMTASAYFPESIGILGWVAEPFDASCVDDQGNPLPGDPPCLGEYVSRLADDSFFSSQWPAVVRIGDCQIGPVSTFQVRATTDGISFGDPVVIETIRKPDKWWADVVGAKIGGLWTPPEGVVNFDDIQAAIQTFEGAPGAPHWSAMDLEAEVPNAIVNMTDVQLTVLAFEGAPYPFSAPANCP